MIETHPLHHRQRDSGFGWRITLTPNMWVPGYFDGTKRIILHNVTSMSINAYRGDDDDRYPLTEFYSDRHGEYAVIATRDIRSVFTEPETEIALPFALEV